MTPRKRILLKLTGEIFLSDDKKSLSPIHIATVLDQLKTLADSYQFGIVVGGGNFFRGNVHGKTLGVTPAIGHSVGMLATMMNGLLLKDLLEQRNLSARLLSAIPCPEVGIPISQQAIQHGLDKGDTLIFIGGTGNPFFTTDTNAVLRSIQISADEIWKGTGVDGLYDANPHTTDHAQFLPRATYQEVLTQELGVMDATAFTLAKEHHQTIRIFNIFAPNILIDIAQNKPIGSIIQ